MKSIHVHSREDTASFCQFWTIFNIQLHDLHDHNIYTKSLTSCSTFTRIRHIVNCICTILLKLTFYSIHKWGCILYPFMLFGRISSFSWKELTRLPIHTVPCFLEARYKDSRLYQQIIQILNQKRCWGYILKQGLQSEVNCAHQLAIAACWWHLFYVLAWCFMFYFHGE